MQLDNILDDFDFKGRDLPLWVEDEALMPEWAGQGEVVAKFFSPLEAELSAARLRSEGLTCFLANIGIQAVMPQLQTVIRLHVHPKDAAIAREILDEAAAEAGDPSAEYETNPKRLNFVLVFAIGIGILLAFLLVRALSL